jgi:hypothetical protein
MLPTKIGVDCPASNTWTAPVSSMVTASAPFGMVMPGCTTLPAAVTI